MFLAFGLVNLFEPIAQRHPGCRSSSTTWASTPPSRKRARRRRSIGHAVALAKYPNVSVKLSNLPNSSLEPYPFKDLTPHLKRVFDAYGPQRCHWGTDVTNGMDRGSWRQRLTHFTETHRLHVGERQGLGAGPLDPAEAQMGLVARGIRTLARKKV